MIAVDFGGAQRPGRNLPTGESPLPLPVRTSFCLVSYELLSSMLLCFETGMLRFGGSSTAEKRRPRGPRGAGEALRCTYLAFVESATWILKERPFRDRE